MPYYKGWNRKIVSIYEDIQHTHYYALIKDTSRLSKERALGGNLVTTASKLDFLQCPDDPEVAQLR